MQRRTILAALAAAALGASVLPALGADQKAPAEAGKIKQILIKLYGTAWDDVVVRSGFKEEISNIVSPSKDKERKAVALKPTGWWSEAILEGLYKGKQLVTQPGKIKEIVKADFDYFPLGPDKQATKVACYYRGPNSYSASTPAPLLMSVVDAKTDPKAYLEKTWAGNEEFQKNWVLFSVSEGAFDVTKDKIALWGVLHKAVTSFNIDPNRIFIEGVGAGCKTAQLSASLAMADRLAGLVLRNPAESLANENCGLFPTVVVKGPDANPKAAEVLAAYKAIGGDAKAIELAAPDAASVEGPCQSLADWLKAAKPRELATSYSWIATYDKDDICPNPFTGSLYIYAAGKRGDPTKVKVAFKRDTNTVEIESVNLSDFEVLLNDDLLDLDKDVAVVVNGTQLWKGHAVRSSTTMFDKADIWGEYGRLFPFTYRNYVPATIAPPEKKPDEKKDGDGKDPPKPEEKKEPPPPEKKDGDKKEPEKGPEKKE